MNRDDIIRMAREAGLWLFNDSEGHCDGITDVELITAEKDRDDDRLVEILMPFATLVVAAERERIIAANAPEIEKLNVYIKALEDKVAAKRARLEEPEPYAAQAAMVASQTQGRMSIDPVTGDVGIGTVKWDASAPLVMHPHPAFQATQPQPDLAKVGEVGVWGERQWQGLTDEEIKDHWITCMWKIEGTALPIPEFARAIEAKLKEKNT